MLLLLLLLMEGPSVAENGGLSLARCLREELEDEGEVAKGRDVGTGREDVGRPEGKAVTSHKSNLCCCC